MSRPSAYALQVWAQVNWFDYLVYVAEEEMAATVNSSTLPSPPTLQPSTFVNGEASASSSATLFFGVCAYRASEASRHTASLKRGNVSARLTVPNHIRKPHYIYSTLLPEISSENQIHNAEGIDNMRLACKLAARVLDYAETLVRQSVTTNEIDEAVHQMIIEAAAYPSPLGYGQFPKSVCTSVNECMYHGIPDSRQLEDGDIINIDVAVYLNGYHGDTSKTFLCGNVDDATKKLVKVTEECLQLGISVCKDGAPFQNIGDKICEHAAKFGYGVDRFIGHGVGTVLHSQPLIFHDCSNKPGTMVEGQTFTLEPILTMGSTEFITWEDNWTILTADGSPSAQFEHTILITSTGADILTQS